MTRAVSARELAEAIRAVAAGFRVTLADPPAPVAAAPPAGRVGQPTSPGPSRAGRPRPSCCAACRSASARSWPCWPVATPTAASPMPASCRSTRSAPTSRTCWSSWAYTPSWRRPRWPCARGWSASRTRSPRRPRPEPGGRRRPWVPVRSIVAISSRPAPPPWSAGCSPGALALAPGRPGRHPGAPAARPVPPPAGLAAVATLPTDRTRTWLGPALWANRLQDWRLHQGRVECVAATGPMRTRTVAVLTRELVAGDRPARIGVRTGLPPPARVLRVPGRAGGGRSTTGRPPWSRAPRARAAGSSAPTRPTAASASASTPTRPGSSPTPPPRHRPRRPARPGPWRRTSSWSWLIPARPRPLPAAPHRHRRRRGDAGRGPPRRGRRAALTGGIALVSSSREANGGARHWFAGPAPPGQGGQAAGAGRGPVLGTLYTLNGPVLKLTAQLFPVGDGDPREVRLQLAPPRRRLGGPGVAPVGPGFAAALVTGWDGAAARRYRVLWGPAAPRSRPSRARWPPTRPATASCGSGCSTAPSTATGR